MQHSDIQTEITHIQNEILQYTDIQTKIMQYTDIQTKII